LLSHSVKLFVPGLSHILSSSRHAYAAALDLCLLPLATGKAQAHVPCPHLVPRLETHKAFSGAAKGCYLKSFLPSRFVKNFNCFCYRNIFYSRYMELNTILGANEL